MNSDYYIAMLIHSGMTGLPLLAEIRRNIETKCGGVISFAPKATERSKEAASRYYYYRSIIKEKGEQYLYEHIMRTYDPAEYIKLLRKTDVRWELRSRARKLRDASTGQGGVCKGSD